MVEIGDIYGLAGAATFAISSSMIKRLNVVGNATKLNFLRTLIGAFLFLLHGIATGQIWLLSDLNSLIVLYLILSVTFNVVLGDTSFFESQNRLGVKIATPLVNTFPYVTIILAIIFLGVIIEPSLFIGSTVLIPGVILLSMDKIDPTERIEEEIEDTQNRVIGLILIVFAVLCYALGIIFTTLGTRGIDPVVANSVRLPFATFGLLTLGSVQNVVDERSMSWHEFYSNLRKAPRFEIFLILIAGLFGTYLSSLFLVLGVQEIGASRSSILFSTGPFFALPLAVIWLRERISYLTLGGTILTIIGLWIILI